MEAFLAQFCQSMGKCSSHAQTPYQLSHEGQHAYFHGRGDPEWVGEKCDHEGSCMLGTGFIPLILS